MTSEAALRARIDELEEELRQLKEMLMPSEPWPKALGLPPHQIQLAKILLARSPNVVARETLLLTIWSDDHSINNVSVAIHKLRKNLAVFGVEIERICGSGYRLSTANAARLRAKIAELS